VGLTIGISDVTGAGEARFMVQSVGMNDLPSEFANRISFRVPPTVPRSQRYYWTRLWQELEAEAADDVSAGRVRRFGDPLDAVRWLLDESNDP
jgi:hypothetical protein